MRLHQKLILSAAWLALPLMAVAHQAHQGHPARDTAAARPEQQAWGIAGEPAAVRRTIQIRMTDDMRFAPDRLEVREGETVRLRVVNAGRMLHELVIGTRQSLAEHAEMMRKHPAMEHDEPDMVHVAAGRTGTLVWQFNRPGEFEFACLIPGHYQAGMIGKITVIAKAKEKAK